MFRIISNFDQLVSYSSNSTFMIPYHIWLYSSQLYCRCSILCFSLCFSSIIQFFYGISSLCYFISLVSLPSVFLVTVVVIGSRYFFLIVQFQNTLWTTNTQIYFFRCIDYHFLLWIFFLEPSGHLLLSILCNHDLIVKKLQAEYIFVVKINSIPLHLFFEILRTCSIYILVSVGDSLPPCLNSLLLRNSDDKRFRIILWLRAPYRVFEKLLLDCNYVGFISQPSRTSYALARSTNNRCTFLPTAYLFLCYKPALFFSFIPIILFFH